ncbi:NUDIX hydrolase [Micromonospora sonneratiae]|uniref:NUDIX hydrolase n=1 Tax=Micromonospora sonneratiae TaxID=1184706 RepID=A0ABW3YK10_9ACTN
MTADSAARTLTPLAEILADYRPRTDAEAADVDRARHLAAGEDPWSRAAPLHVTGSALVIHPASRRVLLRWHLRLQAWLQVGGHADPGEVEPLAVALREAREETGLTDLVPWPDTAPVHVIIVPVAASPAEPAHEHLDVRFVLATDHPDSIRPEDPAAALRWLSVEEALATTEPNVGETLARVTWPG